MKAFIIAAMALSFSILAHASDDCHTGHDSNGNCGDDRYFTCFVKDATGAQYSQYSNGWLDEARTQIRAFKKCKTQSPRPNTCKPLGCQDKY